MFLFDFYWDLNFVNYVIVLSGTEHAITFTGYTTISIMPMARLSHNMLFMIWGTGF